ncbi:hypothetical protein CONPUDRAFT_158807 [Coniophora puteana RWD-64-598 SS2]|uniref:Uncharacterized protein n=1 Tax=Coniophora puteana (strain RWD-64-598) TaxID=741705 RepID=A0A5M3MAN4_CONPW|nr:uncharacterized protein CONPUDRAFT_158807 [Coniophora puteana RWD-64-598 SS2]EIW76036.1 hypothetical protein CONPUDRAFT_158807 [Coniophora puteana RWD-64-598 SS2]
MTPWRATPYHHVPTVDGLNAMERIFRPPDGLADIDDIGKRWEALLLTMSCFDLHRDGDHLTGIPAFHPVTLLHYRLGASRPIRATEEVRRANFEARSTHVESIRHLIHDLITALDRLTGGVSLFLHHPGAVKQNKNVEPENLRVSSYLNPRFLALHPEAHITIAELAQTFIENVACANAKDFRDLRSQHCWPDKGFSDEPSVVNFTSLPIIPKPSASSNNRFVFQGRPRGQLSDSLLYSTTKPPLFTFLPELNNQHDICWNSLDFSGPSSTSQFYLPPCSPSSPAHSLSPIPVVTPIHPSVPVHLSSPPNVETRWQAPVQLDDKASKRIGKMKSGPGFGDSDRVALQGSVCVHFALPPSSPVPPISLSCPGSGEPSSSASSAPNPRFGADQYSVILPFGLCTAAVLDDLSLPDYMHNVCVELLRDYLPSKWQAALEVAFPNLLPDYAGRITQAMFYDTQLIVDLDTADEEALAADP